MCESIFWESKWERKRKKEKMVTYLGWDPEEWNEQICKGTSSFTFKTRDMAEVHSILANWMVLLHLGKVSWTQWMQRCAHLPYPFGSYHFHHCSERVWQEGTPVRACCVLTSLLVTKIRERNTEMNHDFERKTKGRVMPALLLCLFLLSFKMLLMFMLSGKSCRQSFW